MELTEFGKICRCKKIQSRSVRYSSCAGLSKSANKDTEQIDCKTLYRNEGYSHYKIYPCRRIRFTIAYTPDLKWISISKINSRSKPKNTLQTTVQGTEHSYHSFTIHPGSDKLLEKTPPVCRA
jgi:hypothetical protein